MKKIKRLIKSEKVNQFHYLGDFYINIYKNPTSEEILDVKKMIHKMEFVGL